MKWLAIAKNEYRIRTSRIRKIRRVFPYLTIGLLVVYVVFITPSLVGLFIDDFTGLILSQLAVGVVQILLFFMFVYFMAIPITNALREEQVRQLEIFLAAPVKPSDVLMGEFLGELPFYAIFVTAITAFFTAILQRMGLDLAQMAITIVIFIVTFLSAIWVGTVVAAVLRTRLGRTARGRDFGRALAMIIALPMVALFYAIQFGGLADALANPGNSSISIILSLLPSSWGAEVIVSFAANPGNVAAVSLETMARLGSLLIFLVVSLWVGMRVANRAYSLEPTAFIASRAKPDGAFYKSVKRLSGGGSFGTLVISVFKDYGRRLENLSNITYIVGILAMMNLFIVPTVAPSPDGPPTHLMFAQFVFPILAVMVTGGVTVQGRETLFVYKKSPSGVGRLVKSRLVQGWFVIVPIAVSVTALSSIFSSEVSALNLVVNSGIISLFAAANATFALGLFLLNPAFSEKSVRLWLNVLFVQFVSIGLFFVPLVVFNMGYYETLVYLTLPLSWLVGAVLAFFGKRKLSRLE